MRTRLQTLLPSVLVLTLVSLLVTPLVALAQEAAISMSPETVRPGSTVEITGSHFPAEHVVELQLTTPNGTTSLATTATDLEGMFQEIVALPPGATRGMWALQATAVDGTSSILQFSTVQEAVAAEAEPAPVAEPASVAPAAGNTTGDIAVLLIIAVVLGGVAFGGIVAFRQVRDESPPGMGKGDDLIWGGGSAETPAQTATEEPYWKTGQTPQPAQTTTQPAQTEG